MKQERPVQVRKFLAQVGADAIERDVEDAGEMASLVFTLRANVNHHGIPREQTLRVRSRNPSDPFQEQDSGNHHQENPCRRFHNSSMRQNEVRLKNRSGSLHPHQGMQRQSI